MRNFVAFVLFVAVLTGVGVSTPLGAQDKKDDKKKDEKLKLDVPYVPTHEKVVAEMLKMAKVKEGETVLDLGCGDGRIVISAVKDFKAKRGIGIDLDPDRIKDCTKRMDDEKLTAEQKKKLTFKQGNVLKLTEDDLKDVDVVTLYLFPEINLKLKPILQKGLKPGARVVSHDFNMGEDWKPDEKIEDMKTDTGYRGYPHSIYLWVIKDKDKK